MCTYNLAFFFGPGLPLGFGSPSGPSAGPDLFTPFFLTTSVGGGIEDGTGVPTATGVLVVDSGGLSPFELGATGSVFETVDEDSFDGDSSLTTFSSLTGATANFWSCWGDIFSVTIMLTFDDFRRTPAAAAGDLLGGAIAMCIGGCDEEVGGWRGRRVS